MEARPLHFLSPLLIAVGKSVFSCGWSVSELPSRSKNSLCSVDLETSRAMFEMFREKREEQLWSKSLSSGYVQRIQKRINPCQCLIAILVSDFFVYFVHCLFSWGSILWICFLLSISLAVSSLLCVLIFLSFSWNSFHCLVLKRKTNFFCRVRPVWACFITLWFGIILELRVL